MFAFNGRLEHFNKGKQRIVFAVLISSLTPVKKIQNTYSKAVTAKRDLNEDEVENFYWQFSNRIKIIDKSTTAPITLVYYCDNYVDSIPHLAMNKKCIIGISGLSKKYRSAGFERCKRSGFILLSTKGTMLWECKWPIRPNQYIKYFLDSEVANLIEPDNEATINDLFVYPDEKYCTMLRKQLPAQTIRELTAERDKNLKMLNSNQSAALQNLQFNVNQGTLMLLDGAAGTGKTFVLNTFILSETIQGNEGIVVAATGLAASFFKNGKTVHSMFGLPPTNEPTPQCKINPERSYMLARTQFMIWDEIYSSHLNVIQAVDICLRRLKRKDLPFGGISVIFSGDLRQTLPIGASKMHTILGARFYQTIRKFHLYINERASNNVYALWLLDVSISPVVKLHVLNVVSDRKEFMAKIYNEKKPKSYISYYAERVILATNRADATRYNDELIDEAKANDPTLHLTELCAEFSKGGERIVPQAESDQFTLPTTVRVYPNCPILLLRNLRPGLCNGTRLLFKHLKGVCLICKVITGSLTGKDVSIPRVACLKYKQYPIVPSFAMTIHKSQGQTLTYVGVDLTKPMFAHGQLYVAFSRTRVRGNITVLSYTSAITNFIDKNMLSFIPDSTDRAPNPQLALRPPVNP